VIEIEAGTLGVTDGSSLSANTVGEFAEGNAGSITLAADSVTISAGSTVRAMAWESQGDGGHIRVQADSGLIEGAETITGILSDSVNSVGDAGKIDLRAGSLEVVAGGRIEAATYAGSEGHGGHIQVQVDSVFIEGAGIITGIFADSATNSVGDAGTIDLTAGSLELVAGGLIVAGTYTGSEGDGGHIRVKADSVLIREPAPGSTGIFVNSLDSTGDAGCIALSARALAIEAGGGIAAGTGNSTGDAGVIGLDVGDLVVASDGFIGVGSTRNAAGNAGTIRIDGGDLVVAPGGIIAANAESGSTGAAGTRIRTSRASPGAGRRAAASPRSASVLGRPAPSTSMPRSGSSLPTRVAQASIWI
jgi:hypothetical protein